ncbi:MAG: hypothetical protein HPY50_19420 [Firmicutes bacterium]|nr:hypothetical protein [Bacillota bacterium]
MSRQTLKNMKFFAVVLTLALVIGLGLLNVSGVQNAAEWPSGRPAAAESPSAGPTGLPWWNQPLEEKAPVEVDMPWGVGGIRG